MHIYHMKHEDAKAIIAYLKNLAKRRTLAHARQSARIVAAKIRNPQGLKPDEC